MALTQEQIDWLAKVASWKFDVDFRDLRDSVTYTGDGVDDLTSLINRLEGPLINQPRILCDVGRLFSSWVPVTVDDVHSLRQRYIEVHGTVSKPMVYYEMPTGNAIEIFGTQTGEVAGPNPPFHYGDFTDFGDGRLPIGPTTPPDQWRGV